MAGRAEQALRADDTPGLAALESLGSGVNTQAFVAARA
jgi:hypothetical protein